MMTDIIGSGRRAALRTVDGFAQGLVAAALLGELYVVLTNVFARAWLHHSFLWADEVARFGLSTLAFIGGASAMALLAALANRPEPNQGPGLTVSGNVRCFGSICHLWPTGASRPCAVLQLTR